MDDKRNSRAFTIQGTSVWTMHNNNGDAYEIMIWQPEGPPPKGGYPVYYLLDANAVFGTFTETVRLQSSGPRKKEPAIIVGIGYPTTQPLVRERRFFDYTLPASDEELLIRKTSAPWPENGGIEQFLDFIEYTVQPEIEKHTSVNPKRRALFGHSLGGFFTLYTLFTRSYLFQYYAAGSPSIWWKNNVLFSYAEDFLRVEPPDQQAKRLFIGIGAEEHTHMLEGNERLGKKMQAAGHSVVTKYACYEEENHISMLLPFIAQIVRDFRSTI